MTADAVQLENRIAFLGMNYYFSLFMHFAATTLTYSQACELAQALQEKPQSASQMASTHLCRP
jgi:hypothetical protein